MFFQHEITRQVVDSGMAEMTEIDFTGLGKILRLFLVSLPDETMAHMDIVSTGRGLKHEGETTALYEAAISEMKVETVNRGMPLEYHFKTENERMKWFGQNILPGLLGGVVIKKYGDDGLLKLVWNYPN